MTERPDDVPGTSDFAHVQEQIRRDRECDEFVSFCERRDADRMRARARAIAAGHPSAPGLSTGVTGRTVAADPVDIHFAAPDNGSVEQCPQEVPLPPAELRTPPSTFGGI